MPNPGYEFFEHTADTGLRVCGTTLPELFAHAAAGLTALLVGDSPVALSQSKPIALSRHSVDALLRAWLAELLFGFSSERFLPGECRFETLTETELRGRVVGERFDSSRHVFSTEVKGITRHRLSVKLVDGRWQAQVDR